VQKLRENAALGLQIEKTDREGQKRKHLPVAETKKVGFD